MLRVVHMEALHVNNVGSRKPLFLQNSPDSFKSKAILPGRIGGDGAVGFFPNLPGAEN